MIGALRGTRRALTQAWEGARCLSAGVVDANLVLQGAMAADAAKVAIRDADNGRDSTYGELLGRAAGLASRLEAHTSPPTTNAVTAVPRPFPVTAGPRYAILADTDHYVVAQWAAWMAGGVAVPLCPAHPPAEIAHVLSTSACSAVLVEEGNDEYFALLEKARALVDGNAASFGVLPVQRTDALGRFDASVAEALAPSWFSGVQPTPAEAGALKLYTSGTTSLPKGVLHTHRSFGAIVSSLLVAWEWEAGDCILHTLPMHHMHGVANVTACAQAAGAAIKWRPHGFRPETTWQDLLHDESLTVFMGVPTMFARLLGAMPKLSDAERRMAKGLKDKFRLMVAGSAALPSSLAEAWERETGVSLLERYGMTEVGMALSNGYPLGERAFGTVGSPLPGVECAIVPTPDSADEPASGWGGGGDDGGLPRAAGPGELWVRGPMLFAGYWQREKANEEEMASEAAAAPLQPARDSHAASVAARGTTTGLEGGEGNGNPWFKTGDIAEVDASGFWRILGRASADIIKSGGYKVSALEVETAVLDVPGVAEAVVLGMPDEGDMGEDVTAVVVLEEGAGLDMATLRTACEDKLARYKMPRRLILLKDLPRNAMGKVNKKQLRMSLIEQGH